MKRWKKGLSLLLAVCLAGSLCACGGGGDTTAQNPGSSPADDVPPTMDMPEEDTLQDTYISEDVQQDIDIPEENFVEAEPELEGGLVILTAAGPTCSISYLNPDTGEVRLVSTFPHGMQDGGNDGSYVLVPPGNNMNVNYDPSLFATRDEWFGGRFYEKMAMTKHFYANGEQHAGWIDTDGYFFDVTEALGLQSKSDFEDPVCYRAVGFAYDVDWNEYFIYQRPGDNGIYGITYYTVPVSNLSISAVEEKLFYTHSEPYTDTTSGGYIGSVYDRYDITGWIDYNHCIANVLNRSNLHSNSYIIDVTTDNYQTYIPETSRSNWNGVLSPDGTQIAFMSSPQGGTDVSIYTVPVSGGDPVRVNTEMSFATRTQSGEGCVGPLFDYSPVNILIAWM